MKRAATTSKPQPKGKTKPIITSLELIAIETERAQVKALQAQLTKAKTDLEKKELEVMDKLREGAVISGDRTAIIQQQKGASHPSWKDVHVDHMVKEHGQTEKQVEAEVKALYPGTSKDVLVIGLKPDAL